MLAGACTWGWACTWAGDGTRRGNEPVMSVEYGSDDCRCVAGGAAVGAAGVALGAVVGARPDDVPGVEADGVLGAGTGAAWDGAPGTGRISGPDCGCGFDEFDSGKTAGGDASWDGTAGGVAGLLIGVARSWNMRNATCRNTPAISTAAPATISLRRRERFSDFGAWIAALSPRACRSGGAAAAACAARRAAAMKFGLAPCSALTGALTKSTAASDAAMRSAADGAARGLPAAEPGSSG